MTHTYQIQGMHCNNCTAKVSAAILKLKGVKSADIQLKAPQATIEMESHLSIQQLQNAISEAGNYQISEDPNSIMVQMDKVSWWKTYKPVLLIFSYLIVISFISVLPKNDNEFSVMEKIMYHFMGGFFLAFSFFKLLDIPGFANSYMMYDIVAKKWKIWGYLYPFVELVLGIAYIGQFSPIQTNIITVIVMSVSLVGVLLSVLNKRKIKCACLGSVFELPMSTITIIEDGLMIIMSVVMLAQLH